MTKFLAVNTDGSYLEVNPATTSLGAASAGEIPALSSVGKLDISFMPTGVGADTQTVTASEALAAGAFVNIFYNSGVANARNALATDNSKPAHGFVLSAVSAASPATIYVRGLNTAATIVGVTSSSIGQKAFLSPLSAGEATVTVPSTSGNILQAVGTIDSVNGSVATINFTEETWIVRA